jgi:aryl-alcohol dehydrogenase-like predicted oxidoreductase
MQQKRLGRTGNNSSQIILGTAAFWDSDQEEAEKTLEYALENGINHIDIAPQYGNAQQVAGEWIGAQREKIFLGCKTLTRDRDAAWGDLETSLELLHTDSIDLYQFHAVTTMQELEKILAPGGAAETFLEAKQQGLVRWLGITGHGMFAASVQIAALENMDLDTIMFPLNPRLMAHPVYQKDAKQLLDLAMQRDLGVMVIKSIAKAPWEESVKRYNCWYEPYDQQSVINDSVRFVLSQSGVSALVSAGDIRLLPLFIQAMHEISPMEDYELEALIEQHSNNALIFDGPEPLSQ